MSNCDGWPAYFVDVEHLPDRQMRLWLRAGGSAASLGTVDRITGMYPVVKDRVATHLGLASPEFYVELRIPRPSYVRIGERVLALEDDGRRTDGIIRDWINGEMLVEPVDLSLGGGGLFSPDDVTFLDGDGATA
jgi:hypothetical protein